MKKSIYSLKKEELVKLKSEIIKTEYYRGFVMQYFLSIIILLIIGIGLTYCIGMYDYNNELYEVISISILLGIGLLITAKFLFKRVELVKEYYELKNEKKD